MRRLITIGLSFAFFSMSLSASAASGSLPEWAAKVREVRLNNGMTFLLYPRGEAPIFSAYIRFKAGGIDEEIGKTGLAHFLEHMAFKGTETIGTKDFSKEKPILDEINRIGAELTAEYRKGSVGDAKKITALRARLKTLHEEETKYLEKEELAKTMLENGGGDYNATTSKDMTSYFVSLPADKLRFWADLESQRIFRPIFREFYQEKDVVLEERRMRVDNDPDGRLYEAFIAKAFEKSPYRWPTIGSHQDVLGLTTEDLKAFYRRFYHPSSAVGALVGNFDVAEAQKVLEETFGVVDFEGPPPQKNLYPAEPAQTREKRVTIKAPAQPRLLIGYHKPTLPEDDDYAFDILDQIFGEGRTSRLYKALVLEKKLASHVESSTGVPASRLSNLFLIEVSPLEGRSADEVLKAVDQEIEAVKAQGVTVEEVQKAKNRLTVDFLWQLKANEGLASQLSYFQVLAGDWKYLATYLEAVNRFGPEDIKTLANKYLVPTNRTVGVLTP